MNTTTTIKQIKGASNYGVDEQGNVWNTKKNRMLKASPNGWAGYRQVKIVFDDGTTKCMTVHKIVWTTFMGEVPAGLEISHKDDDKTNNALDNLEVVTHAYNVAKPGRRKAIAESKKRGVGLRRGYVNKKGHMSEQQKEMHRAISKNYWNNKKENQ